MIKRARIARMITIFGYFLMLLTVILGIILPAFGISMRYVTNKTDPGKLMPLQTYYVYDRDKSPYYELTYILQSFGGTAVGIMYTAVDGLLGMLVFHVCGQLENLKTRIIHLNKFQNFESALSNSVQDHMRLVRLRIIENVFHLLTIF